MLKTDAEFFLHPFLQLEVRMKVVINNMSFYYSDYYNPIFENVNLIVDTDWSLGLIGRNGRGKSTFLNLLMGKLVPVSGKISMDVSMEYFPYKVNEKYDKTIDVIKENIGGLKTIEDIMEEIIATNDESRYNVYSDMQEKYAELSGYEMEARILKEMADMNLDEKLAYRDFSTLSGGEKTRMLIIVLFLRKSSFVLLDEPTNHLDIDGKEMVAEYLNKKKGYIVVSHDRDFLDKVTNHIMSINKTDINIEKGNYSTWKKNMDMVEKYEFRIRDKLEREIKQLERCSKQTRKWASVGNSQKNAFKCNARSNGCRSYMHQAKKSEGNILENINNKKKLLLNYEEAKDLQIIQKQIVDDECLIKAEKICFTYPNSSIIIKDMNVKIYHGDRIWIKGKNGVGKSTLLKLLSGELEIDKKIEYSEGIKISVSSQETLWASGFINERFETKEKENQLQLFLSFCDMFDLPDNFLTRPLETYSSGELKKVDIARTLSEGNDILFFDEPLNFMDVFFREQLERAILEYEPTIVFVEHDSRFGSNVSNRVIEVRNNGEVIIKNTL